MLKILNKMKKKEMRKVKKRRSKFLQSLRSRRRPR